MPPSIPLPPSSLTGVTLTATSGNNTYGPQIIPLSSLYLGANSVQITAESGIPGALQLGNTIIPSINCSYASGLSVVSTAGAPYIPPLIILDTNGVTIKYTGGSIPYSPYFIQANPRNTGMEWFAVVDNSSKSHITNYSLGKTTYGSLLFIPTGQTPPVNTPVPFKNIVTTLMTNMSNLFYNTESPYTSSFNDDIGSWDTSRVTNTNYMFNGATAFNKDIGYWNMSNVIIIADMFKAASAFNKDIGSWNISNVKNMNGMFYNALNFNNGGNSSINLWNTSNVESMLFTFNTATKFNQPIGSWNTSKVTTMYGMFQGALVFNQDIGSWDTSKVTNMNGMFYNAYKFNNNISTKIATKLDGSKYVAWNTSKVIDMSSMFRMSGSTNGLGDFNNGETPSNGTVVGSSPLYWDTSSLYNIAFIFYSTRRFNQNISTQYVTLVDGNFSHSFISWNTENLTSLQGVFTYSECFNNGDIQGQSNKPLRWNTSKVTSMYFTFGLYNFFVLNQGIIDASNLVSNDKLMFAIGSYNQPMTSELVTLGNGTNYLAWDLSKNTNTSVCFQNQYSFNSDLSNWNTSNVTNMSHMFKGASSFNQPIGSWNTLKVTNMYAMFYRALAFNRPIGYNQSVSTTAWNTSNVISMDYMFNIASAFSQDISGWIVTNVNPKPPTEFRVGSGLTTAQLPLAFR